MSNISTRLKAADPSALAARFGSAVPATPRAPTPAPGPQARADMALISHLRSQADASLALRDDMWAPATPVVFTPAPMKPRGSLLDMLLN